MLPILLFLNALFVLNLAQLPTYDEIKKLGGDCSPYDTCSNPTISDNKWLQTCDCQPSCLKYGTCCLDFSMIQNMKPSWQMYSAETCEWVPNLSSAIFVKARCKRGGQYDETIKSLCESARYTLEDPLSVLPVTNPTRSVTYKNYFCALCNDDNDRGDLVFWQVSITKFVEPGKEGNCQYDKPEFPKDLTYDNTTGQWGTLDSIVEKGPSNFWKPTRVIDGEKKIFEAVNLGFSHPPHISNSITFCDPGLISSCDPDWKDETVKNKCHSYTGMIYMSVNTSMGYLVPRRFRNVHCGICNFAESLSDTQCHGVGGGPIAFSFSWLLDINPSDGDRVGEIAGKDTESCKEGDLFDPFFKKCRTLRCIRPDYVVKDEKCVPS